MSFKYKPKNYTKSYYNNTNNTNNSSNTSNTSNSGNSSNYNNTGNYSNTNNTNNSSNSYNTKYQDDKYKDKFREDNFKILKDELTDKYNYVEAEELLEKDDIFCSPEVINMECLSFDDMGNEKEGLKENLLQGIYAYGFEKPARIQSLVIPQIISGREVLAQSQSGTGKTGAFVISGLQLIDETIKAPQIIIISPTCDLAQQTFLVAKTLGSSMTNINFSFTVGGVDRLNNIRELGGIVDGKKPNENEICQFVVSTPGRLKDLLGSYPKLFDNIKLLIIDECDELFTGNFETDIIEIINALPRIKISFFSATLNKNVVELANKILENPVKILIKKEGITLDGIKQTYVKFASQYDKIDFLIEMLNTLPIRQFIVYVNSIKNSDRLKEELEKQNYSVMSINSSNSKVERAEIIRNFKEGKAKCLISTDLLSRGIDIQQLSLVINYDLPRHNNIDAYIHRIGRSGRFGKKGLAINFITNYDEDIQKLISVTFKCRIEPFNEEYIKYI